MHPNHLRGQLPPPRALSGKLYRLLDFFDRARAQPNMRSTSWHSGESSNCPLLWPHMIAAKQRSLGHSGAPPGQNWALVSSGPMMPHLEQVPGRMVGHSGTWNCIL